MNGLDGRHRWELTKREAGRVTHTCRACGRTQTFELLIPDAVLEEMIRNFTQPNLYRALTPRDIWPDLDGDMPPLAELLR